jgi:transposase
LARRESVLEDSAMPAPLDPETLPLDITALRDLLLHRETEHAAELQAARAGLQEQVLRNEKLKLRLAKLLRERFGASSEKLRTAIEQLELILGDLEEQIAETAPAEPQQPATPEPADTARRRPARRPLPANLPRKTELHPAPCACPKPNFHTGKENKAMNQRVTGHSAF